MKRALTLLATLALGAAPLFAGATTVPTLSLAQQAKKADVIVRATLGTPGSVKEGEVTWLAYPLTVTETVAGDPASLPQREGKPVLYVLSGLEGLPDLQSGQEAFLLLYSRRLDSPIVGLWQGVYPIQNGKVTRPTSSLAPVAVPQVANPQGTDSPAASAQTNGAQAPQTAPSTVTPTTPAAGTTSTPGSGTLSGAATPPATPPTPGSSTPAASPATPSPTPASPAPTTVTPGTATLGTAAPGSPGPGTASTPTPVPNDPNAIETDPAKFRDALRAARGAR